MAQVVVVTLLLLVHNKCSAPGEIPQTTSISDFRPETNLEDFWKLRRGSTLWRRGDGYVHFWCFSISALPVVDLPLPPQEISSHLPLLLRQGFCSSAITSLLGFSSTSFISQYIGTLYHNLWWQSPITRSGPTFMKLRKYIFRGKCSIGKSRMWNA